LVERVAGLEIGVKRAEAEAAAAGAREQVRHVHRA